MVHPCRTAQKSTGHHPTGQLAPRDVPSPLEPQPNSPQYVPQWEDSFKIVVTVPAGEDTQEAQQLLQNDDHDNDHGAKENNEEEEEEEEGNKAEGKDDEDYTPLSDAKKDEMFRDADEIKTTQLEFRIKRVLHPRREEYKAIVEIFNGPNVLSHHKGPTSRATY
jgi:hypothetical protein